MVRKGRLFLVVLALAPAAALRPAEMVQVLSADVEGGAIASPAGGPYASLVSPSILGDLDYAPAVRFSNNSLLNPLLFADSTGENRPVVENTLFVRSYNAGAQPTFTWPLGQGWSLGARLLASWNWNQQTLNEAFGDDIYDYQEFGGGLLLRRFVGSWDDLVNLDFSHRDYPNYHNVDGEYQAAIGNKDYYLKDSYFVNLTLHHRQRLSDDKVFTATVHLSERLYTDDYVVQDDDSLDLNERQQDLDSTVDLGLAWRLNPTWALNLGLGGDTNTSNQNTFDTSDATATSLGVFTAGGENFEDLRLDPALRWVSGPWSAGAAYELLMRSNGRYIQDANGAYAEGRQADVEHGLSLDVERDLGDGFKVRLDGTARVALSNQAYAYPTPSNYSYFNAALGLVYNWRSAKSS